MRTRTEARQLALQYLYMSDLNAPGVIEPAAEFARASGVREEVGRFALDLVGKALGNLDRIDGEIRRAAVNWDIGRIAPVERNILRLGCAELLFLDTPPKVALDEAIELAKAFGNRDSGGFVNGVLDRIRTNLGKGQE